MKGSMELSLSAIVNMSKDIWGEEHGKSLSFHRLASWRIVIMIWMSKGDMTLVMVCWSLRYLSSSNNNPFLLELKVHLIYWNNPDLICEYSWLLWPQCKHLLGIPTIQQLKLPHLTKLRVSIACSIATTHWLLGYLAISFGYMELSLTVRDRRYFKMVLFLTSLFERKIKTNSLRLKNTVVNVLWMQSQGEV